MRLHRCQMKAGGTAQRIDGAVDFRAREQLKPQATIQQGLALICCRVNNYGDRCVA